MYKEQTKEKDAYCSQQQNTKYEIHIICMKKYKIK
jgi:hypothetical protein